jgi:hypothetical protein
MSELSYTVWYKHDDGRSYVKGSYAQPEMARMNARLCNAIPGNGITATPVSVYFDVPSQTYFYGTLDNVPVNA